MDNRAHLSQGIAKDGNYGADAAMTGMMNSMGQDGSFKATQLPIKNRINALDVSERYLLLTLLLSFLIEKHKRCYQASQ